jgi:O-antigen ligase
MRGVDGGHDRPGVVSSALAGVTPRWSARGPFLIAALIVGLAVLVGLAAGDPSPLWWIPLEVIAGCAMLYASARHPFASLLVILGSCILLMVVLVTEMRSINPIDVLMPPVLLTSLFGRARREARAHRESGPDHDTLNVAERRLTNAAVAFYALAVLSLFQLAHHAGAAAALDSALVMTRAIQGLLFYPLAAWWLRTPERIARAWNALVVAGAGLAVVNIVGVAAWGVKRAGMTLYLNDPGAPISSPNECGTATLVVAVVLLIRQAMRPQWINLALGMLMFALLGLTQSRSGILAWATFGLFTLRWVRPSRLLIGAFTLAALLALMPQTFWQRMMDSLVVEKGSFAALSFFERVYGWRAAWGVVMDYPWTGVGYQGFRFVSHAYNSMQIVLGTVENYYYEILVSMGVVGLGVLGVVIVRLFQVGRVVARTAPRGTLAHHMARFHAPLMMGLLVANLTANNFMGMVGVAQVALWTAVLVRSGHHAVGNNPDVALP